MYDVDILLSLFFMAVGLYIMYIIIKAGINNSVISNISNDLKTIKNQMNRDLTYITRELEKNTTKVSVPNNSEIEQIIQDIQDINGILTRLDNKRIETIGTSYKEDDLNPDNLLDNDIKRKMKEKNELHKKLDKLLNKVE
jgi:predicted PurR-regulated permease PerM